MPPIAPPAIPFDSPATYRIRVRGALSPEWSDRLGGMTIVRLVRSDQSAVTELMGRLVDQAALTGVLNCLYELHLPVELVELVPDGATS